MFLVNYYENITLLEVQMTYSSYNLLMLCVGLVCQSQYWSNLIKNGLSQKQQGCPIFMRFQDSISSYISHLLYTISYANKDIYETCQSTKFQVWDRCGLGLFFYLFYFFTFDSLCTCIEKVCKKRPWEEQILTFMQIVMIICCAFEV